MLYRNGQGNLAGFFLIKYLISSEICTGSQMSPKDKLNLPSFLQNPGTQVVNV